MHPSRIRGANHWLRRNEPLLWQAWTAALLVAVAAAFVVPAMRATGGRWPAPLDDVYIYYGFARSWALGHPSSWFPGNGYSSGSTSVLYPLLLVPGYALGLTGSTLGAFATALGLGCLFDACRSVRALLHRRTASWGVAPLLLAVPLLDWNWWSGMETALWAALFGRALLATAQCRRAPADRRSCRQLALGGWLALAALTRPETIACTVPLGIVAVYGARSLGTLPSLVRCLGPSAAALGAQALVNRGLTGEWAPAGAVRKLIWSAPFVQPEAAAVEYVKNLVVLAHQAFERALGGVPYALALLTLALVAALSRRHRLLAAALLLGALGTVLIVASNATARFQNLRYAAPALVMVLLAAALGLDAAMYGTRRLRRRLRRRRVAAVVAAAWGAAAVLAPASQFERQIDHFALASRNIIEQHGEVARRLRALAPTPRRVLVNDAGAIPYLSGIPPIDGLGLGGFRGLPFARASVHGTPAVVELIERLPPLDRPDVLALYPSWWTGLADVFGRPIDAVRITHNVICAAEEKVIYRADWSSLAAGSSPRAGQVDELDVADLVSERQHDYRFPAPHAGWLVGVARSWPEHASGRARRYDAGRVFPQGQAERLTVRAKLPAATTALILRTDAPTACTLRVDVRRSGRVIRSRTAGIAPPAASQWLELTVELDSVQGGDELSVTPIDGQWRSFHYWLVR